MQGEMVPIETPYLWWEKKKRSSLERTSFKLTKLFLFCYFMTTFSFLVIIVLQQNWAGWLAELKEYPSGEVVAILLFSTM